MNWHYSIKGDKAVVQIFLHGVFIGELAIPASEFQRIHAHASKCPHPCPIRPVLKP